MKNNFFITLPSTASTHIYPKNNQSRFRVQLPQTLELKGQWSVGLAEIHLPTRWHNVDAKFNQFRIHINQGLHKPFEEREIRLTNRSHNSWSTLINDFQKVIPPSLKQDIKFEKVGMMLKIKIPLHVRIKLSQFFMTLLGLKDKDIFTSTNITLPAFDKPLDIHNKTFHLEIFSSETEDELKYDVSIPKGRYASVEDVLAAMQKTVTNINFTTEYNPDGHVTIGIPKEWGLEFPSELTGLGDMLGFKSDVKYKGQVTSEYGADLKRGVHGLYLYTNLIFPQIVGDTYVPLRRVIPVEENNTSDTYVQLYVKPDYYPLAQNRFESIEIDIRTDYGQNLSFSSGKS